MFRQFTKALNKNVALIAKRFFDAFERRFLLFFLEQKTVKPIEKIESESAKAIIPDTIKVKKEDEKKPVTPVQKPADIKNKKAEKPKTNNDY